ncbi:MAG: ABC transporter permease [Pseudomonadota bacterium]|nr:ABC transporter permease [Pseudomonadota bacterium]
MMSFIPAWVFSLLRDNNIRIGGGFFLLLLIAALFAPELAPHDPNEQDLFNVLLPPMWEAGGSADFPLGTDALGQCVLSRLIYGAQVVVIIALTAPVGAAIIGSILAMIGGYFGGRSDWLINRVVETWLSFPAVVLALILMIALSPGLHNVIISIVLVDWARFCKVLRADVLVIRRRDYVAAARITGARPAGIIIRDVFPGIIPTMISLMALEISIAIVAESILSFVGMSVGPDVSSWGGMISDGLSSMYSSPYPLLLPMIAMILTVLATTFLGQGVRQVVDLHLAERTREA